MSSHSSPGDKKKNKLRRGTTFAGTVPRTSGFSSSLLARYKKWLEAAPSLTAHDLERLKAYEPQRSTMSLAVALALFGMDGRITLL